MYLVPGLRAEASVCASVCERRVISGAILPDFRRSARFTHDHRGLQILRVKDAFDYADSWLTLFENIAQGLDDSYEAARAFP